MRSNRLVRLGVIAVLALVAIAGGLSRPSDAAAQTLVANSGKCPLWRGSDLYSFVRLYYYPGSGYQIRAAPTQAGRAIAYYDFALGWAAMKSCAPSHTKVIELLGKTTIRQQFDCHAYYGTRKLSNGEWWGGPTWDLEGWRPAKATVWDWIWDLPPCGAASY